MSKILILLTCIVIIIDAKVFGVDIWQNKNLIRNDDDRTTRMSQLDLQHQKFLLDILNHILETPSNEQILQLGQNLVIEPSRYSGGIDNLMSEIIELALQQRLLRKDEVYTIRNRDHIRQFQGIYKLFVRSNGWDTLQQNIAYFRINLNSWLFVNSLISAIRDREDTQKLIVPGMQEIFPELFFSEQLIKRLQNVDLNLLTSGSETLRPNLLDLLGFGKRPKLLHPYNGLENDPIGVLSKTKLWREFHIEMALRKLGGENEHLLLRNENKIVLPIEFNTQKSSVSLLTDDIGLKVYVQNLVNDLTLIADETLETNSAISYGIGQENGGTMDTRALYNSNEDNSKYDMRREMIKNRYLNINNLQEQSFDNSDIAEEEDRNIAQIMKYQNPYNNYNNNMNTYNNQESNKFSNYDSLMHVSRRRIGNIGNQNGPLFGSRKDRALDIVSSNGYLRERGRDTEPTQDNIYLNNGGQSNVEYSNTNLATRGVYNNRLLHVNRRRLNQDGNNKFPQSRRFPSIGDGRQVDQRKYNSQNVRQRDILKSFDESESYNLVNDLSDTLKKDQIRRFKNNIVNRVQEGRITENEILNLIKNNNLNLTDNELVDIMQDAIKNGLENSDYDKYVKRKKLNKNYLYRQRMDQADEKDGEDKYAFNRQLGKFIDNIYNEGDFRYGGRHLLRRVVDSINNNQAEIRRQRIGELLLHNLQQLSARINLAHISLDPLEIITNLLNSRRVNNPRLLESIDQTYALRMNEMQVSNQRNRMILEKISAVERRLDMIIGKELYQVSSQQNGSKRDQEITNEIISQILLGRSGNVGILQILRELLQTNNFVENNSLNGLEVTLSDPAMQLLLRRIVRLIDRHRQEQLHPYRQRDLQLDSVRINGVRVSKLQTTVDESETDLFNLMKINIPLNNIDQTKMVVARQKRLNHKEFTIDFDVSSDHNERVIIRTLLGPKTDLNGREVNFNENRQYFLILDAFAADLQPGRNRINRKSRDITWTAQDTNLYTEIYKQIMSAIQSLSIINLIPANLSRQTFGFPQRLLLPLGRADGLPMQLLVIITAQNNENQLLPKFTANHPLYGIDASILNLDGLPLGFPLDRKIDNVHQFLNLSNVHLQDVIIYHKKD